MNRKAFVLGIALLACATGYTADAATGVVDIEAVLKADTGFRSAVQVMAKEEQKAATAFEKESKGKTEKEVQSIANKYKGQLNSKNNELMAPIQKRIFAAIEKIAKEKNLDTVVVPNSLLYGKPSVDITPDVIKENK